MGAGKIPRHHLRQTSESTCLREIGSIFHPEPRKLAPCLDSVERERQGPAQRSSKPRPEPRRSALQRCQVHLPQSTVPSGTGGKMRHGAPGLEKCGGILATYV